MEIKYRLYPYPVLSHFSEDYVDSRFNIDITQKKVGTLMELDFDFDLKNSGLNELINKHEASYCIHVECPQTMYRKVVKTGNRKLTIEIPVSELNGKVEICSFVVADKMISNYSSDEFVEEFQGFTFDIERGCKLAIGKEINIHIDKTDDDLSYTPSIFSIIKVKDIDRMNINLNRQKIEILLPEDSFSGYNVLKSSLQHVMHAMVITPALASVLERIKSSGEEIYEFEDYRWYRALKKILLEYNINLDLNGLENLEMIDVAQMLIDSPLNKAFGVLRNSNEEDDEE